MEGFSDLRSLGGGQWGEQGSIRCGALGSLGQCRQVQAELCPQVLPHKPQLPQRLSGKESAQGDIQEIWV